MYFINQDGRVKDLSEIDSNGKTLLIQRGQIPFTDKIANVLRLCSSPGIILNNSEGQELINRNLSSERGWKDVIHLMDVRFISYADAQAILQSLNKGEKVKVTLEILGTGQK